MARIKPLFEEDAASQLDYDDAIAQEQQTEAAVEEAQADLKNAQLELDYTELKAPIRGLIGESGVDVGALIRASNSEPLTTVSQIDPIHVYFSMSALDYLNARRRVSSTYEDQKPALLRFGPSYPTPTASYSRDNTPGSGSRWRCDKTPC